ncbi:MAG TPA: GAF domain-containing protein, partial [Acidimicrobiales bacterium]|nr:GAF domain-containing protein [Acidimicrobiales bacterium]
MTRWVEALLVRRLGTAGTIALLAIGLATACVLAEATHDEGVLGPAGVFLGLVFVVAAVSGPTAGLVTSGIGLLLVWFVYTPPRWSPRLVGSDVADLLGYAVVATALNVAIAGLTRARAAAQTALNQVAAMVRSAPVGMAFVDERLRIVDVNEALAAFIERPVDDLLGAHVDDVPQLRATDGIAHIRHVLDTGDTLLDVPLAELVGGQVVQLLAGFYPVFGEDERVTGVGVVVREVTAERERDLLLSRVSRLQDLTQTLAAAGTTQEVVDQAVRSLAAALGARAASFTRASDGQVLLEGAVGYEEDVLARWCAFSLDEDVPLAEAIRTGAPVLCRSEREFHHRWPHLGDSQVWSGAMSLAALPLRGESSTFGAIGLSFDHERSFEMDDVLFLMSAATACATAYERSSAFESERDANRRLKYLLDATAVLSASLDPQTTLQRLAELAVPTLADWCAVHLVQGSDAVLSAIASEDPELTALVRDVSLRHPIPLGSPGLGTVATTGQSMILNRVTLDAVRSSTQEGELVDMLSRLRSIAIVPMTVQGSVIGTVMLSNITDRDVEPAEAELATDLAARASQAVANARLFTDRARVASTLQASLLPPSPPAIPGID